VFACNLREEYQWLSDAMKIAGLSDEQTLVWLERASACGLENKFTVPRTAGYRLSDLAYSAFNEALLPPP
jgi:hypothetical protein